MMLNRCSAILLTVMLAVAPTTRAQSEEKPSQKDGHQEEAKDALVYSVSRSEDDAEEGVNGQVDLANEDLDLGQLSGFESAKAIGVRFEGIRIPEGQRIKRAFLQFTSEGNRAKSKPTELKIRAELAGDAESFKKEEKNISSRTLTETSVTWLPQPWHPGDGRGERQQTPDLSALIQEVIEQDNWKQGNALVLVITGNGERDAISFDGGGEQYGPMLHVETNLAGL